MMFKTKKEYEQVVKDLETALYEGAQRAKEGVRKTGRAIEKDE